MIVAWGAYPKMYWYMWRVFPQSSEHFRLHKVDHVRCQLCGFAPSLRYSVALQDLHALCLWLKTNQRLRPNGIVQYFFMFRFGWGCVLSDTLQGMSPFSHLRKKEKHLQKVPAGSWVGDMWSSPGGYLSICYGESKLEPRKGSTSWLENPHDLQKQARAVSQRGNEDVGTTWF